MFYNRYYIEINPLSIKMEEFNISIRMFKDTIKNSTFFIKKFEKIEKSEVLKKIKNFMQNSKYEYILNEKII